MPSPERKVLHSPASTAATYCSNGISMVADLTRTFRVAGAAAASVTQIRHARNTVAAHLVCRFRSSVDRRKRLSHPGARGIACFVGQALSPANRFFPDRICEPAGGGSGIALTTGLSSACLLYTSDAADD